MNKTAIIVDSVCTLPPRLLEKYNVKRVPISVSINGEEFPDPCDQSLSLEFFRSGQLKRKNKVTTSPPSVNAFAEVIHQAIAEGAQQVFVQTVNRMQGETYNQANAAISKVKAALPNHSKVTLRVMDSRTVFSGQGLMVAETLRRLMKPQDASSVRREMDSLSSKIHTFVLPKSPLLALERAQKRGEKSVGWTQAAIANVIGVHPILCIVNDSSYRAAKVKGFEKAAGQLFTHARAQMLRGLLSPIVVINYAGPIEELKNLPGFADLEGTARECKVQLIVGVMSLAGGIYTSPGSLNLALMAEPHDWQGE
ncbi:MAG TPA: DegV family protein [Marinagarivorans sp.]